MSKKLPLTNEQRARAGKFIAKARRNEPALAREHVVGRAMSLAREGTLDSNGNHIKTEE